MKIMLMTDMEASAGILNHDDWVMRTGQFYEKGTRLLTEEVNAAINGFMSAGCDLVVVIDGHGQGGIDPELLHESAELIRGAPDVVWPFCMDDSFDAVACVGQHAKAGTPYSHITHTQWFNYIDMVVNGVSIGEYGQFALSAKELGIPHIFASGEFALHAEIDLITPGTVSVPVKWGLKNDGAELETLTTDQYRAAKLSARHLSPRKARQDIYEGAKTAVARLRSDPENFSYVELAAPYHCTYRFREMGDRSAYETETRHDSSFIGLLNEPIPGPG